MARSSSQWDMFLRLSAAVVGVLPVAVYIGLATARWLPADAEVRAAVGYFCPLPVYVLLGCLVARDRSGVRAWAACALAAVALKAALISIPVHTHDGVGWLPERVPSETLASDHAQP